MAHPIIFCSEDRLETQVFQRFVEAYGHQVDVAASPQAALSALEGQVNAILVVSLGLRHDDWVNFIRRVRRVVSRPDLPILVLRADPAPALGLEGVRFLPHRYRVLEILDWIQHLTDE